MRSKSALSVALAAGCCTGAAFAGVDARPTAKEVHVAHIYYHVLTGEMVVTPMSDVQFAGGVNPVDVWRSTSADPCGEGGISGIVDDPFNVFGFGTFAGSANLDWGDIDPDTGVDCVTISWSVGGDFADTDTDSDGIGDGIEGFGRRVAFYERDNGFDTTIRVPLIDLTVANIPGALPGLPPGFLQVYTLTADFSGTGMTVEFGDTDGSLVDAVSGAVRDIHNPMIMVSGTSILSTPSDLDSDGRSDFSYITQYYQPGGWDIDGDGVDDHGLDLDSDGIFDGDKARAGTTGITQTAPEGSFTFDSSVGGYTYTVLDGPPAAQGIEDVFSAYAPYDFGMDNLTLTTNFLGNFWYGGFECTGTFPGPDGEFGTTDDILQTYDPFSQDRLSLHQFGDTPCAGDLNGDGVVDFFDVGAFLSDYNGDCTGGLGDFNSDGICDFFDVSEFLVAFAEGCP